MHARRTRWAQVEIREQRMTDSEQQIDQLRRQLAGKPADRWGRFPLKSDRYILSAAVSSVRPSGEEHPLISIFLAFHHHR